MSANIICHILIMLGFTDHRTWLEEGREGEGRESHVTCLIKP